LYGQKFFVIPEPKIPTVAARVMGLDDATNKMSKSSAHIRGHAIRLEDEDKELERSFKRAVTDSGNEIRFSDDPEKAGVNNLLGIYQAITGKTQAEVEADFAHARGYGDLKKQVAEVTIAEVAPVRERYHYLMQDPAGLDRLLAIGAEQATAVAAPKLKQMKEMMGLVLPK
jgi:tryptophanyl-tRNA synthetase